MSQETTTPFAWAVPPHLDGILDGLEEGVVLFDADRRILHLNAAARRLGWGGGSSPATLGDLAEQIELIDPVGQVVPFEAWPSETILRGERLEGLVIGVRQRSSGRTRTVELSGRLVQGVQMFGMLTLRDLSEHHRLEEQFLRLLESPIDALMVVDKRGLIRMVNRQMETLFGYRRDELIGKNLEVLLPERYHRQHHEHHLGYYANPRARPMGTGLDLLALRRDGVEFPVEISLTPLETEGSTLVAAAIRDISDRKEAERALHESRQHMALHIEKTPLAVMEWEVTDHIITAWNPAAERIFGFSADEVVGKRHAELMFVDSNAADLEDILSGRVGAVSARDSHRCVSSDGRILICEWYFTPLADEAGEVVRVAALALDITARQGALDALLSAQEEERGRIARDLHDQVGQTLTAMLLGLNAALEHPNQERLQQLKGLAVQSLDDVRRISRDLRPSMLDELGLEAAIRRFARELSDGSGVDIHLLSRVPKRLARNEEIVVYRVVQEALTNVVRHARAEHASVIMLATYDLLHLTIEDDGIGFDPDAFSLSDHVGLSGMRERLELQGGSLKLESAPGRGTLINARLPLRR